MDRNAGSRLRNAVKENNLFLVRRLVQKVDMRNQDPNGARYTSLAWAAVSGHEETFEYLLSIGHDDVEVTKDAENNTVIGLLAALKADINDPYRSRGHDLDLQARALRMARLYYDRYPFTLDLPNFSGKTALHIAALKGNEEFVRMLYDLGGDIDLPDLQGNTPLHYASAWGHLAVVQTLIERGCRFAIRNNEGFMAVDYAYSTSTMEALQDSARTQFENNKRQRQEAKLAARQEQQAKAALDAQAQLLKMQQASDAETRLRSASSATNASASTDMDGALSSTASIQPSTVSSLPSSSTSAVPMLPSLSSHSALTPVATRMLQKDADAMRQYLDAFNSRGRSGSQSGSIESAKPATPPSATAPPPPVQAAPAPPTPSKTGSNGISTAKAAIHRLRQSVSAAQLRSDPNAGGRAATPMSPPMSPPSGRSPLPTILGPIMSEAKQEKSSSSRRSPFSLLSRGNAQGDSSHRRTGSNAAT